MAKAKKAKPRDLIRWRVSLITATPAKFIDFTMAPDAETAEEQVAEAHDIGDELRPRLIAVREDLERSQEQTVIPLSSQPVVVGLPNISLWRYIICESGIPSEGDSRSS